MITMTVNGKTITVPSGHSVSVTNGVVLVDGVRYGDEDFAKNVLEIKIAEGDLVDVFTDKSVSCSNVTGGVVAGGSVSCGGVGGNVKAGGSVSCGRVWGSVSAGGSVSHG